jgi:hypothetical protein
MLRTVPGSNNNLLLVLAAMLLASLANAQRFVLPHGTGGIVPAAEWTVVRGDDLRQAARPNDPTEEPARTQLFAAISELRLADRLREHVLLHAPGPTPGSLRLVDAYSAEQHATTGDLLHDGAVASIRQTLESALPANHAVIEYFGHERATLYPCGSLVVRFDLRMGDHPVRFDHHVVPAGDRLQYFDVRYDPADAAAPAAIDALLQTFDGAREELHDPTLRGMILGGIAGAIAGVLTALLRRRRQQRLLQAAAARAAERAHDG